MPPPATSRFSQKFRRRFRRVRVAGLLLALGLVAAFIFLHLSGLPGFLRRPLLEKLHARGLDLQVSSLRLHFYRGLVAENVRFGQMGDETTPRLTAKEADLNLDWLALLRLHLEVSAVSLRDARLIVPVTDTNRAGRELTVDKIRAGIRFLPNDAWSLDDFHATFAGADFSLAGIVTNASAIPDWPFLRGVETGPTGQRQQRLRNFADLIEQIHFAQPPALRLVLGGDARDLQSFSVHITANAPAADTPWGNFSNGVFTAQLFPAAPAELSHAELNLQAASAQSPWAYGAKVTDLNLRLRIVASTTWTNQADAELTLQAAHASLHASASESSWADGTEVTGVDLRLRVAASTNATEQVEADLTLRAAQVMTRWASATNSQFTAQWVHALTNAIPLSGHGELRADAVSTRWASGRKIHLASTLATATNPPPAGDSLAGWTNLWPYQLDWTCRAAQINTEKLDGDEVSCAGSWRAPVLVITNLHTRFPDGELAARAQLDVASRAAGFELRSDFDIHRLSPSLPETAQRWLAKYSWATPPHLAGSGAVVLPAWTNAAPDWSGEVLPTLRLAAQLTLTNGAYLGVPADWMHTLLTYTNLVWHLPDLVAGRPEGELHLVHIADDKTHEFYFGIHSTIDPHVLRPLLETNVQSGLDFFQSAQPPLIEGAIWGRWHEPDSIGFTGRVAVTNFSFRDQGADSLVAGLRYTNQLLEVFNPDLWRGTQHLSADGLAADFRTDRFHITNGFSTFEPMVVARCLGPITTRTLEPYVFRQPPFVHVNGYAPLRGSSDVDLRFDVDGGPFEWWKLKIPQILGQVHWLGDTLVLTNMHLTAYDGTAAGFAHFDFSRDPGTEFQFTLGVTNADLRLLMADLSTQSSKLEGRISGLLVITNANSDDDRSWNGHGQVRLHDGLIWSLPVFGVLSKPLNNLAPGLGSARMSEATARFGITNTVVYSDNLEMRSPTMRLHYNGTVDLEGRVDARIKASPLRDTLVLGPVLSVVLWPMTELFVYKITGTLSEPKGEPVYVPKFLIQNPLRTFEELFTGHSGKTNAPPVFKDPPP